MTTTKLDKDQEPWLTVKAEVMAGKYDFADSSTKDAIRVGLRSIGQCEQAMARLEKYPDKRYTSAR